MTQPPKQEPEPAPPEAAPAARNSLLRRPLRPRSYKQKLRESEDFIRKSGKSVLICLPYAYSQENRFLPSAS